MIVQHLLAMDAELGNLAGKIFLFLLASCPTAVLVYDRIRGKQPPSPTVIATQPLLVEMQKQFATVEQLEKGLEAQAEKIASTDTDLRNQMKELRTYVHEAVHVIQRGQDRIMTAGEEGRERLNDKVVRLGEFIAELRGEIKGLPAAIDATRNQPGTFRPTRRQT